MSAIQPSIVARLKPQLVPKSVEYKYGAPNQIIAIRVWQPKRYVDQVIELTSAETCEVGDTADLLCCFAIVAGTRIEDGAQTAWIYFSHKIEA